MNHILSHPTCIFLMREDRFFDFAIRLHF
jgi:hypothetical protein